MLDDTRSKFESINFTIRTPDGTANIGIVENSPGKIGEIFFSIGKAGSSINAYCYTLARLVVRLIESGTKLEDLLPELSNITSARKTYDLDGVPCRSGPEALYIALYKYNVLNKDVNKKVEYSKEYRPARWGV